MIALAGTKAETLGRADEPKRRSYEAGHKPKFLVVIDERPSATAPFITRAGAPRAPARAS